MTDAQHADLERDHSRCERIRMLLFDVGLDPERVMCPAHGVCVVGYGYGNEGWPIEEVVRMLDRALELAHNDGTGCDIPGCDHRRSNRGYDLRANDGSKEGT